jgi:branched-chain amino acid aminotransferase
MATEYVYLNGDYDLSDNYIDLDNGHIPASFLIDSNSLYGDGTFEGIRIYNGRIFKLDEHLNRLWNSAAALQIEMPCTREELAGTLCELGRRNNIRGTGYIRLVVTRGRRLDLGINTRKVNRATVFIIARELQLYPKEFYEKGLAVITARVPRTPKSCVDPNVKTCNYINNIMAVIEANEAEVPEVIMLTTEGAVCECSADNIFIVKDGRVITPPEDNILVGVTRNTILSLCDRLGIPADEKVFGPEAVHGADEVFLTGSGAEVAPIVEVDKRRIADGKPGPVTNRLLTEFRSEVNSSANSIAIFV